VAGPNLAHLPVEWPHFDMIDRGGIFRGLKLDHIGMQQDPQPGRSEHVAGARSGESLADFVEAPQLGVELPLLKAWVRQTKFFPDTLLVVEIANFEELVGLPIIGIQLCAADRPATVRHPVPFDEIDRVHQRTAAAPSGYRPTEEAQPGMVQLVIVHADVGAPIERLRRLLIIQPAAFKQADGKALPNQSASKRDPGGAGADDADV
jgi:hypothetical protein